MSGYSKIYCIGGEGGFMGSDGMNPIDFQILIGDGNRQWLEVKYFNRNIRPMGRVRVITPKGPDPIYKDALLDACLAFFPEYFQKCLSLTKVVEAVGNAKRLDFDADGEPDGWAELREEARLLFGQLIIYFSHYVDYPLSFGKLRSRRHRRTRSCQLRKRGSSASKPESHL